MDVDALLLARMQFAFTVSFHIIFPAFTIGLSAYVATLLLLWMRTGSERYHRLARFWTKIFAVSFAMGVVSGIVLSYQFGTNWSVFSVAAGNVVGPLIGYEVLTAFFLEASFLGIMLFGWNRVPPWLLTLAAVLVAVGTCMSAFWILSANSWMQTPTGHEVKDGIAYPLDWIQVIFNPSFPYRFAHMVNAAYLTTAFVVLAVAARFLLARTHGEEARTMMRMAIGMIFITAPLQAVIGDLHGLNTLQHQPAKVAAMEGHWSKDEPGALTLFGIPDKELGRNRYEIAIPHLGSLILTHSWDGRYPGLKDFPENELPPVLPVFISFRVMVGIGLLMIATGLVGAFLWWRDTVFESRWFLRTVSYFWPLGFLAILAGWITTEIGRQPYVIYGLLRTENAMSPVGFGSVLASLIAFVLIYTVVFGMGIYYINRMIAKGPQGAVAEPPSGLPNRPLSAAERASREATGRSRDSGDRPLTVPGE